MEEISSRIDMEEIEKEVQMMRDRGIPRCCYCKKDYKKVEKESGKHHSVWKPDCGCVPKNFKLCMG